MCNFLSFNRFFLGGPLSVRGFDFKGIGPRRGGNIVLFWVENVKKLLLVNKKIQWRDTFSLQIKSEKQ